MPDQINTRTFRKGQMVSDKPEGVSSVGLVVSGRIEVFSVALDGREVQLNSLTTGDCFGVSNLLTDEELETVLQCREETSILYVSKSVLLSCMEQDAQLALRYATLCNQKIQFLLRRIELLTIQSCRARLVVYLLEQQDEKGIVHLVGSRDDLARQLGISRAALFRELSTLQSMNALTVTKTSIVIEDQLLLEELVFYSS